MVVEEEGKRGVSAQQPSTVWVRLAPHAGGSANDSPNRIAAFSVHPGVPRMAGLPHRLALLLCLLIVAVQTVLIVGLVRDPGLGEPHEVPLAIAAPGVVAQSLAERANELADKPFAASPIPSADPAEARARARSSVGSGSAVAALVVDLRGTRDTLVLDPSRDVRLNESVLARVRSVAVSYERTVDVEYTGGSGDAGHPSGVVPAGPADAYDLALAASVVGFVIVLVISLLRGPVAPTPRQSVRRLLVVAGLSTAAGPALLLLPRTSLPGPAPMLAALGALSVGAAAMGTLALEALAGLTGLTLGASIFFVLATPLITRTDVYLLPAPWALVAPWTRTGATLDAIRAVSFSTRERLVEPVLVLLGWLVVSTALLLVAERTRALVGLERTSHSSSGRSAHLSPSGGAPLRGSLPRRHRLWRLHVLGTVLPLALVLAIGITMVPVSSTTPAVLPSTASQTSCLSTGRVRSVDDLNRITTRLRASPAFQGGDVGADVRLQDGRRLWVFGDTLRSADFDGRRFVRNSMLVAGSDCLRVVLPADHGALIPDRRDGVGYWPMSLGRTQMPGYDLISVATQRVRTTGNGPFSFETLGPSIAVFVVPRGGTPQLMAHRDIGADTVDRSSPTWGAATVVHDGWTYLYGTANPGEENVFGFSLRVARARSEHLLEQDTWWYWDGEEWTRDAARAVELIPARGGVSQTLSVFESDGTWDALSKRDEFLGTDLAVWTAPAPTGPFDGGRTVAKLPSDAVTGELRYMPLAHPDLLPEKGTVVVSYSRNTVDTASVVKNPLLYRPRFLRVELP